jgi:hypothetical protein
VLEIIANMTQRRVEILVYRIHFSDTPRNYGPAILVPELLPSGDCTGTVSGPDVLGIESTKELPKENSCFASYFGGGFLSFLRKSSASVVILNISGKTPKIVRMSPNFLFRFNEPVEDDLFLFISVGQLVLVKQVTKLSYNTDAICAWIWKDHAGLIEHTAKELTHKNGQFSLRLE